MTETQRMIEDHRDEIYRIAKRHGARNLRLFGSVARGEDDPSSDIDLLVDLEPGRGLLDLGGLLMDLRDFLQLPVEVATPALLKPRIRERVLREAVSL